MSEKLISVVITAYNASAYIRKTLSSVLDQTYDNIEIVIIDDGSIDSTKEILSEFSDIEKVKVHFRDHTGNVGKNLNDCIKMAKGEVIAVLGADDTWVDKNKLKLQMEYLEKEKIVCSDACIIDEKDQVVYVELSENGDDRNIDINQLLRKNCIFSSSVLAYKSILEEGGYFDETNGSRSEDYYLWIRISQKYNIKFINKILIGYRIHGKNLSMGSFQNHIELARRNIEIISPFLQSKDGEVVKSANFGLNVIFGNLTRLYHQNQNLSEASLYCGKWLSTCEIKLSYKFLKYFSFYIYSLILKFLK